MKETLEYMRKQCALIDGLVEEQCVDPSGETEPILDGIVDIDKYYNQKIKILWILKEPYDSDGGGWRLLEKINSDYIQIGKNRTYQPMIYVCYGIFQDFKTWSKMEYIRDDPTMALVLNKIAYINIKKLPGGKRTPPHVLRNAYEKNKNIILKQINTYKPNVIIGGNTLQYLIPDLNINSFKEQSKEKLRVYTSQEKILIDAYHPNQTQIPREVYVDGIIRQVHDWWTKK